MITADEFICVQPSQGKQHYTLDELADAVVSLACKKINNKKCEKIAALEKRIEELDTLAWEIEQKLEKEKSHEN